MIVFPNCKINLGLNIISRRPDGYHNLETVFYPIPVQDALEAIVQPGVKHDDPAGFSASGTPIPGKKSDNLCLKAYALLKKDHPSLPSLNIHLHKVIPAGAGLGGGSSNGAFMLRLLNDYFKLALDDEKLSAYAQLLGSDCPFFILNKPCLAKGTGNELTPIDLNLEGYKILLVVPRIRVETRHAFLHISPRKPAIPVEKIIKEPLHAWKNLLQNDFEQSVFREHREIAQVKSAMYEMGAVYASMSGTGSAVYGIFHQSQQTAHHFDREYFIREVSCK